MIWGHMTSRGIVFPRHFISIKTIKLSLLTLTNNRTIEQLSIVKPYKTLLITELYRTTFLFSVPIKSFKNDEWSLMWWYGPVNAAGRKLAGSQENLFQKNKDRQ